MVMCLKWKLLNPVILSIALHETKHSRAICATNSAVCRNLSDKLRQLARDPRRIRNTPERRITEYP